MAFRAHLQERCTVDRPLRVAGIQRGPLRDSSTKASAKGIEGGGALAIDEEMFRVVEFRRMDLESARAEHERALLHDPLPEGTIRLGVVICAMGGNDDRLWFV